MAKNEDQFSVPDAELLTKLQTLVTYSAGTAVAARLGIAAADNTALGSAVATFATAQGLMGNKNNVTKTMTQTRDTARGAAVVIARKFAPKWYYNNMPPATATDVLSASLVPHADTHTTHEGGAIGMTVMEVNPVKGHQFDVTVKDSLGSEGKPVNIVFIRVRYFVVQAGTTAPVDPADFCKFTDNSKHPIVLTLPAIYAGLPIAISSCYVDAQGNEGLYCDVVNTNIS
jgi:hypothetical protein